MNTPALNNLQEPAKTKRPISWPSLAPLLPPILAFFWAYWPVLVEMAHKWQNDDQYSHGYLVPVFVLALLYMRRDQLDVSKVKGSWWGLVLLGMGLALRLAGAFYYYNYFDRLSLIPVVAGLVLFLFGWHVFRWSLPPVLFLFFMIPLPFTAEHALAGPLRRIGTLSSTYIMQTIGMPAVSEGNLIVIAQPSGEDVRIGVENVCSGLRMLMIFFALATGVAMLSRRTIGERIFLVLTAIPIALISNIGRITITGILHVVGMKVQAEFFHDHLAAFFMMPLALLLLWFELWILDHLFIEEGERPMRVGLGAAK